MDWSTFIQEEMKQPYFQLLAQYLTEEYRCYSVFPPKEKIFQAFAYTPYDEVKVVLLGQDPYHGEGQAQGLSFSIQKGRKLPPSLQNIYKELYEDLAIEPVSHGELVSWAKQGVLLLNTVLTVRKGEANSHQQKGWETFTDHVLEALNQSEKPIVFLLFGRQALNKRALIDEEKHYVIATPHPSPLSAYRGFFGSHPFSKANQKLADSKRVPIQWQLPEY
ncbi:uracil-DNA glycosylase [Catellicoccus marimammalium]|uniref:Uracil-DNA glycosylase n=1 Tax=Catellicoccus marimammalium M35/04/3 TaxID=1234409 RepID=K8ZAC1_9ENTE|nr:uracil-DNA glycosylase [Catellicoccus marimammalium]EKU27890.1 Uracil-DNA glycosylase, family 1 [Catellicoccus marimammalium M35/04/3]